VQVQPANPKVLQPLVLLEDALGTLDVHAELVFLLAGRRLRVRLVTGIDVGVDAQRADGGLAHLAGDAVDVLDLRLGLDVKRGDARVDRHADLVVGLADAGVDDLLRVAPRLERAEQLAAGGHVHPAPLLDQHLADVQVGVGLDRVADRRVQRFERIRHLPIVPQQRGLGVNVDGRSHLRRDAGGRDILAVQFAVLVVEEIHGIEG